MWAPWINAVVSAVSAAVVAAVAAWVKSALRRQRREGEALRAGMRALLREQLVAMYERASERGYMPVAEREAWEKDYEAYKGLGGNGAIDDLDAKKSAMPTGRGA